MTKYQRRCLDMFVRVRGFGATHQERFPPGSPGGKAMAAVHAAQAEIDKLIGAQLAAVDDRRWRARARASITRFLLSMTRAARQIARIDRGTNRKFIMPSPRTDEALLETARTFLREAAPLEERFIAVGMPPRFLDDFRERTEEFERAVRWRREARTQATAARAGLEAAFRRGFDAVLGLDVVMGDARTTDSPLAAAWKSARRVDRARKHQAKRVKR